MAANDFKKVLVLGGGKIGVAITAMLSSTGEYDVTVGDVRPVNFDMPNLKTRIVDASSEQSLTEALKDADVVINALPFFAAKKVAKVAAEQKVHYFDLTEDVAATNAIRDIGKTATTALMPQCGLAPGFIGIAGFDLARQFDQLQDVKMRVGALTRYPTNALKYNLTWSTDGLINEYCEPCDAIVNGEAAKVQPLEGLETLLIDGDEYEAFNTSGGLGTLCETLEGKVRNLDYKTMRFPGHNAILKLLINDLRMIDKRDTLKDIFEHAIPYTSQDKVVVFVSVTGWKDGKYQQKTFASRIFPQVVAGMEMTAIQLTTAGGICAAMELMRDGKLPRQGFVAQEQVKLDDFLANRWGGLYQA